MIFSPSINTVRDYSYSKLKDVKNHAMARVRACESHNLAHGASALVVLCA